MKKLFAAFTLIMAFALSASAQTTNFSNSQFSATFNGSVETETRRTITASNVIYSSDSSGITEVVVVRTVDHDIPVDTTSSQFYRANLPDTELITQFNSDGVYQGHPFSYGLLRYTESGITFLMRERVIIVNSRTVIFIKMIMTQEKSEAQPTTPGNALVVWQDFENSLNIK